MGNAKTYTAKIRAAHYSPYAINLLSFSDTCGWRFSRAYLHRAVSPIFTVIRDVVLQEVVLIVKT